MKKHLLIRFIFIVFSCSSKEDKLFSIIAITNKYQSIDFFHMQIPPFYLENYSEYDKEEDYHLVRHLYDDGFEKQRRFYIINLTKKTVILSGDDYHTFFEPIALRILGKAMTDLSGDVYMESLY